MEGNSDSSHHSKAHRNSVKQMERDVQTAHDAWDAWKSHDPEAWDWALDQRERIAKKDPKAWNKAMKEVDAEEAAQKRLAQAERQRELAAARELQAEEKMRRQYMNSPLEDAHTMTVDPVLAPRPPEILHPGYAPHSSFAPEPPNSPAYDAYYNKPRGEFHGLDLGLVKLGVQDGSLAAGVNVGIAATEVTLGKNTGVAAEFMPYGGLLHARTNANIGFEEGGMHSEVGAGANFFDVINGDADFAARLGRRTGVDGDVRGKVWPVNVQADAGAGLGPDGLNAYTGANTGIADWLGVRSGAHFDLNDDSGAGAGVGLKFGEQTLDFGPSIDTYGNRTLRPNIHFRPGDSTEPTFYPTGDRDLDS
jgi:hypothetical protein